MRLTQKEVDVIKATVNKHLSNADVYLFGSRVDDAKRGGDIDILIIGTQEYDLGIIMRIKSDIKRQLGDQKIDVAYERPGAMTPFGELVKMEAVPL
jgi:predicted nucleotidyltransferase